MQQVTTSHWRKLRYRLHYALATFYKRRLLAREKILRQLRNENTRAQS